MADEIRNSKVLADAVRAWMKTNAKDMTVDTLLTWPRKSEAMAKTVCERLSMKPTESNVHEVLRAALAARKRGDLNLA